MASLPSQQEVTQAVRELLVGVQLEGLTQRIVREKLEAKFGQDLSSMKQIIKDITMQVLAEQQHDEEEDEDEDEDGEVQGGGEGDDGQAGEECEEEEEEAEEEPARGGARIQKSRRGGGRSGGEGKGRGGFAKEVEWSDEMAAFLGVRTYPRTQVTKRLWEHIKEHKLQDPNNGQRIICDDILAKLFGVKTITMFQMSKAVSKHSVGEPTTSSSSSSRKRKTSPSSGSDSAPKKRGFPVENLSEQLQSVVGRPQASRNEVVKALWTYIKENNLQNPQDKREIICDQRLRSIFGQAKVTGFGMNKLLGPHLSRT